MKILIVTQYFWPESFRINDVVLGLKERGHDVTVFTGIPNYPQGQVFPGYGFLLNARQNFHGAQIHRVPLVPRGKGGGLRLALNYLSFAILGSFLAPFLCRKKFDLIFVYEPSPITVGLPALVLKKFKGTPIIFWVQDLWPKTLSAIGAVRSEKILNAVDWLVRFVYRGCDRILIQSKVFLPYIVEQGISACRIKYFPNSAEEFYKPLQLEAKAPERKLMPLGFKVIFAGNIGVAQNFETILNAADILRENKGIQWVIIGDGRRRTWVEVQIKLRKLERNVYLLGKHPAENMPRFFALADALLVTLKKDPIFSLTIPSKVQSYLASAKPIIAALDGEGARVIEEAGAGLVCPAEDAKALADAVRKISQMSEDERQTMGRSGRTYFENNFARSILLERIEGWMRELKMEVDQCAS